MSERTPTPWHIAATEHTELVMGFKDNTECVLAELDTDDVSMQESEANAAFIVKAVNSHDALEDFVRWVDSWVSNPVSSYSVNALDGLFGMTRDKIAALASIKEPA